MDAAHWDQGLAGPDDGSVILLDVRTPDEVAQQGLMRPDVIHIPLDSLRQRLGELDPSKKIYVTVSAACAAIWPAGILSQRGFRCSIPPPAAGGSGPTPPRDRVHDAAPTHPCGIPIGEDSHGA